MILVTFCYLAFFSNSSFGDLYFIKSFENGANVIFFLQQQTQEIVNISPILILFIGGPYGRDSHQLPLKVCKIALKTFIQKSSFNQNSGQWLSYGCLMLYIVLTWGWIRKPDSV